MSQNFIYGLENNNNIYMHYKMQHFNWHRQNSPDYDFSDISNSYIKANRQRYQKLATENRPSRIDNIKSNEKRKEDVFRAIATFSSDNIQENLDLMTQEINKMISEINLIAEEPYSLSNNIARIQLNLDRMEIVVDKIEEISDDLLSYIQQDKIRKQDIRITDRNLFLIKTDEINAFQELRNSVLSLKSLLRSAKSEKKSSYLLSGLAQETKAAAESMIHSISHYAVQQKLKEKTRTSGGSVSVSIDTYPHIGLVTAKTNDVIATYNTDNVGSIIFEVPYGDIKEEKRFYFNPFKGDINVRLYLNKLSWEARYLMFNSMLFKMKGNRLLYNRYAASFAVEDILRQRTSGAYIFLKIDDNTIVPLSTYYSVVAGLRTAQPRFDFGKNTLSNNNIWVGRGKGEAVTDDQDETRPELAWIRAKRLNDAILRLRAKLIFPIGKSKASI